MSHVVQVRNIQCTDESALRTACDHLGLKVKDRANHKLYGSQMAVGLAIELPGWQHPVVIDTQTGECRYDNFNGSWGAQEQLDKLIQRYAVEAARNDATARGLGCVEEALEDGSIKLTAVDYS